MCIQQFIENYFLILEKINEYFLQNIKKKKKNKTNTKEITQNDKTVNKFTKLFDYN